MHLNIYHIIFFLIISLIFSSCNILDKNSSGDIAGKTDTYAGIYTQGIEDSNFNPCFAQEESWQFVEIQDTSFAKKVLKLGENPIFMRLKGTPGRKGEYKGIYATYDRQVKVEEVVGVGTLQEKGCG